MPVVPCRYCREPEDAHARVCPVPLINANPNRALTREVATSDWVDLAAHLAQSVWTPAQREALIEVLVQLERHVTAYG